MENTYTKKEIKHKLKLDTENEYGRNRNISGKSVLLIAVFCSLFFTIFVSTFIQIEGDHFNTIILGHDTILDEPALLQSLKAAQAQGVEIGIHGWEHENYSALSADQIRTNLAKSKAIFDQAGLSTTLFVSPYEILGVKGNEVTIKTIESTGVKVFDTTIGEASEYTWNWRDMTSFDDPRFKAASDELNNEKPKIIVLHAMDYNQYTEKLLSNYLMTTKDQDIIIRVDDVEVNTPNEVVDNITKLKQYKSVGRLVLAVIPSGTSNNGNPKINSIAVNDVMKVYFAFFIITALFPVSFFVIWKLLSEWNTKKYKKKLQTKVISKYPKLVSVIVPAYNEEKSIARCIEKLLDQDYEGAMDIIVVNDGSRDKTAEIASQYPIKLINLAKNGGKANALNRAVEDAKGDIIVFSDGDSDMAKDAVSSLIRCFDANPTVDMVTGNVLINDSGKGKFLTYCQMVEYHLEQEIPRYLQALNGGVMVCPGPITAVKRSVCDEVKFSDETIVEDADFTVNALRKSLKVIRDPYAKVYTNAPKTLKSWYKQRKRWWYGNLQVWNIHKPWSEKNPWMLYNYFGYVVSLFSLILMALIPYIILQYNNASEIAALGIINLIIPVIIYIALIAVFFKDNKKLLVMLIPYMLIYSILKMVLLSYVYICYITRWGLDIQFGSRLIRAK
jgi:cellulose synthase/poly-beta-1,6-N-acetylglucosamine synthase-like glycosyltransferase